MCAAHLEPGLSTEQDGEGDGGGRHGVGGGQSVLHVHARLQLDHKGATADGAASARPSATGRCTSPSGRGQMTQMLADW